LPLRGSLTLPACQAPGENADGAPRQAGPPSVAAPPSPAVLGALGADQSSRTSLELHRLVTDSTLLLRRRKGERAGAVARALHPDSTRPVISVGVAGTARPGAPELGRCIVASTSIYADEGWKRPRVLDCGAIGFPHRPFMGNTIPAHGPALGADSPGRRGRRGRHGVKHARAPCARLAGARRTGAFAEPWRGGRRPRRRPTSACLDRGPHHLQHHRRPPSQKWPSRRPSPVCDRLSPVCEAGACEPLPVRQRGPTGPL